MRYLKFILFILSVFLFSYLILVFVYFDFNVLSQIENRLSFLVISACILLYSLITMALNK